MADKKYTPEEIFNETFYKNFDKVRFEHFNTLGIDFKDMRILELGAGIGNHTEFLITKNPKQILAIEGRKENYDILKDRFVKHHGLVAAYQFDLDNDIMFDTQYFDWIYNYGILYHLKKPFDFIKNLSNVPHTNMILETCVELDGDENNLAEGDTPSQALNRVGSRPNMYKVIDELKKIYEKVTVPENQPKHQWFDIHNTEIDHVLKRVVIICENKLK